MDKWTMLDYNTVYTRSNNIQVKGRLQYDQLMYNKDCNTGKYFCQIFTNTYHSTD